MNWNKFYEVIDGKGWYVDSYPGCVEPGYPDNMVIAANWNEEHLKGLSNWIERREDVELEWSDEWTGCGDCGKAVRTQPDSYQWEPYYVVLNECELVCLDCISTEDVIEEYQNKTKKAVPSHLLDRVEKAGFHCLEEDEIWKGACKTYESGWHPGQNDTPESCLKEIYEWVGSKEWFHRNFNHVFAITGTGQFDVSWTILVREKAEDELNAT